MDISFLNKIQNTFNLPSSRLAYIFCSAIMAQFLSGRDRYKFNIQYSICEKVSETNPYTIFSISAVIMNASKMSLHSFIANF